MIIEKQIKVFLSGIFRRVLILFLLIAFTSVNAQDCLLDKEPVQDLVQDYANILSEREEEGLRQALIAFNDSVSNQILIVTVNDLCGYDKAQFTYTLGEKWGVGQGGKNNGVVIMVKPHGRKGDRHAFIAPGYGLEGVLPDIIAKRIVENEMIPYFKKQDFYSGIARATTRVMEITGGEYTADEYANKSGNSVFPFMGIIFVFILIMVLKASRTRKYASTNGMSFWAAWALMNASSRSHGGYWGGGGSSGGSFGGGGFGGFGGGSFGGGGAGGSW